MVRSVFWRSALSKPQESGNDPDDEDQEYDAESGRFAGVITLARLLENERRQDLGRVIGTAQGGRRQREYDSEWRQADNQHDRHDERSDVPDAWNRNEAENLDFRGAVHLGRVIKRPVDLLNRAGEDDVAEGRLMPDEYSHRRVNGYLSITKPLRFDIGEAQGVNHLIEHAIAGVVDARKERRRHRHGEEVWDEEGEAKQGLQPQVGILNQRRRDQTNSRRDEEPNHAP